MDVQGSASPSFTHPLPSQTPSSPPQQLACFFFCGSTVRIPPPMTSLHDWWQFLKTHMLLSGLPFRNGMVQITLLSGRTEMLLMEHMIWAHLPPSSLTIQLPASSSPSYSPSQNSPSSFIITPSFLSWAGNSTGILFISLSHSLIVSCIPMTPAPTTLGNLYLANCT